ncbi:MAG: hypothetical protein ACK48K_18300, partial [Planctomycetota bacterium]
MNPKAFGWFSKLFLLIALACGLTTLQSIGLGQADDQATQAWLAKLRSIEKFESSTTQPKGTVPNTSAVNSDSSLAEPPS